MPKQYFAISLQVDNKAERPPGQGFGFMLQWGMYPVLKKHLLLPIIMGWTKNRYSSTKSASSNDCTRAAFPVIRIS